MDNKAFFRLSYGLYVLTSEAGGIPFGCMINTAIQQTSDPAVVSVTVNKQNNTHDIIERSGRFCVSALTTETPFELIKCFGYQSGRTANKFAEFPTALTENGLRYIERYSCAYIEGRVTDSIDLGTHTQFIAEVTDARVTGEGEPLTYAYYQSNIKPKPEQKQKRGWRCRICGYFHEGEELPSDFICPICKHGASDFEFVAGDEQIENNKSTDKGDNNMKKYVCPVCGYVHEGNEPPEFCPQCKVPGSKFVEQKTGNAVWADEHVVGIAKGVDAEIIEGLRANFTGECTEVGMYLAMARVAHREGYPEIGLYWEKAAYEEAEHAAKFAELLGEVVTDSTKKNLEMRVEAESGACDGKKMLAKRAKELNLDAIHDTVHEMAKDEARHGRAFEGLLKRYFG